MVKTVATKMYYSIKEVSELLDEAGSTLRYWESEFQDVISPRRSERGVRFYSEKDIEDIRLIKYLIRDNGLTFDGARKKLKNNKESAIRQSKVVQHLKNIREELKKLGKALDEIESAEKH